MNSTEYWINFNKCKLYISYKSLSVSELPMIPIEKHQADCTQDIQNMRII